MDGTKASVGLGKTSLESMPMEISMRADRIDRTSWSRDLKWAEIEALAGYMSPYRVPQGGFLFHEHAQEAFFCLLLEGNADVVKEDSNKGRKVLRRFGPGQAVGEMSLLDLQPRSASLIAATRVVVLVFTRRDLNRLAKKETALALRLVMKLARTMSERLRQTSGALVELL